MLPTLYEALNTKEFQEEYKKLKHDILNGVFYENLSPHFTFLRHVDGRYMRRFFCKDSNKKRMFYFENKRDVIKRLILFFIYKSNSKNNSDDPDCLIFKKLYPKFLVCWNY